LISPFQQAYRKVALTTDAKAIHVSTLKRANIIFAARVPALKSAGLPSGKAS